MHSTQLPPRSTITVELLGLQDIVTRTYPTTAIVTLALYDANGVPLVNGGAVPLTYVTGTTGADTLYRGVVSAVLLVTPGTYEARVTAIVGDNAREFAEILQIVVQ